MGTQVVPSSAGGGKAGSQPQDLVANWCKLRSVGELGGIRGHQRWQGTERNRAGGRTRCLGCGSPRQLDTDPWA